MHWQFKLQNILVSSISEDITKDTPPLLNPVWSAIKFLIMEILTGNKKLLLKYPSFFPKIQGWADTGIRCRIPYPNMERSMVSDPVSESVKFFFGIRSGIRIRKNFFWYPNGYPRLQNFLDSNLNLFLNKIEWFLVSDPVSGIRKKFFRIRSGIRPDSDTGIR